jgi:AraC family transcriptional regulator
MVEPTNAPEPLLSPHPLRDEHPWHSFRECPIPYEDGELLFSSYHSHWKDTYVYVYRLFQDTVPRPVFGQFDAVVLHLHNAVKLERRFEGAWKRGISSPNGLCINPKYAPTTYQWTGSPVCAAVSISPSMLSNLIHEIGNTDPTHVELIESFNFHDPAIEYLCRSLVNEVQTAELGGQMFAELLGQGLGVLLLRKYSTLSLVRTMPVQKLTPSQLRAVDEYIDAHLEKRITLAELGAFVNLSASYFAKLFKASTGIAPHQYVIKWRIERAKGLLLEGKLTIAEIATKVGFTDQSHLTYHFKRLHGITPRKVLIRAGSRSTVSGEINETLF